MTTSEPTTGEITTKLYGWIAKAGHQERCLDELIAINRLESQEKKIAELTVRAEQAEAIEKAAVKDIEELLSQPEFLGVCWACKKHNKCKDSRQKDDGCEARWRGQPQDGEGK